MTLHTTTTSPSPERTALGVFVGGRSSRMGGQPKGLLSVPGGDEPLVLHALRAGVHAGLSAAWLVGDLAAYDAPVHVAQAAWPRYLLGRLTDDPPGVGPLGGLRALLAAASEHRFEHVVVVACARLANSQLRNARISAVCSGAGSSGQDSSKLWCGPWVCSQSAKARSPAR